MSSILAHNTVCFYFCEYLSSGMEPPKFLSLRLVCREWNKSIDKYFKEVLAKIKDYEGESLAFILKKTKIDLSTDSSYSCRVSSLFMRLKRYMRLTNLLPSKSSGLTRLSFCCYKQIREESNGLFRKKVLCLEDKIKESQCKGNIDFYKSLISCCNRYSFPENPHK